VLLYGRLLKSSQGGGLIVQPKTLQTSTASTFNSSEAVDTMHLLLPTSTVIRGGDLDLLDRLIYPE
jgi:hypothetical protein